PLEPGARRVWLLLLCASHDGGEAAAGSAWHRRIDGAAAHFADDEEFLAGLPRLTSEDGELRRDAALAQANLRLLEADYPDLGRFFLAGLPEYPQLFGCDTTYTVPGAAAAGFGVSCRGALATLARYAERACGRVPHEITTNGRVFNPGNIQETPQLAIALWDHLRWTGDLELARRLFPVCREGLAEYIPAMGGPDPRYPIGDGMIERMGMGSRKLDSACYVIAGLRALARLAAALGEPDAAAYTAHADAVNADFERDWWLEDEGLYADSMHTDGRLQLDGHWTQVLPVQLGLAAPERAERVLARVEAEFVNRWGLVHTRGREEAVWTLPTGLLALAAFQTGRPERGLELARNIALTARHGTLGTFKELIPEGLCFVQLWSAGLYLQAIYEGLLGLRPDAPAHALAVAPAMPPGFGPVTVRGLEVGEHRLNLTLSPRALELDHVAGPQALTVSYAGAAHAVAPGEALRRTG
ncbi:MAG TPA: amylo-alpha-1,6-glucosidase, partial [Chloroflexaceae bacterium]|nr:amylo-alpha-1,6-glucosidase [Chloroflexaceae bacterium]